VEFDPDYLLLGTALLSLLLFSLNQKLASPVIAIFVRWLRWLMFALGGAYIAREFHLSSRPFWVLASVLFIFWLLIETVYNWLAITALSESPLPLFPRYQANTSGEEWPTHPRLLKVRTWLRAHGYQQAQSLRGEIGGGIYLRISVYQNAAGTTRVQVTFVPQPNGTLAVCYTISTCTEGGLRYVTDNLYLPFGGFYPENWLVERRPWKRKLGSLIALHEKRLSKAGEKLVPWTEEPLSDINQQQSEMERLNTELGFLMPHYQREEYGKMTYEGRFRVWREVWLLDYFGISNRYE